VTGVIDASLTQEIQSYGFHVSTGGVGAMYFNVGDSGEAFGGYSDYDDALIIDLLLATDAMSFDGLLYDDNGDGQIDDFEELLRVLANDVYSAINEQGDI
jgi:hypothetical protein